MDFVIALIFYSISFVTYRINRKIINPLFVVPFLWANLLLFYNLIPHVLYPLQGQFLLGIFLWVISYVFGGLLINYSLEKLPELKIKMINDKIFKFYYWIIIIFAPLCVYLIIKDALRADMLYFFVMLRSLNMGTIEMESSIGLLSYIFNFTFAGLLLKMQNYDVLKKGDKRKLNILILLNVLLCLVTMARTSFLFLVTSAFLILSLKGQVKRKHYFIVFFSFVLLMVVLTFVRTISESGDENSSLVNMISLYLFGGMPAFDTVSVTYYDQFGSNVFRFFYAVFNSFGANFVIESTIYDYVNIPIVTNVYTVMCPFFKDFGYFGIVFFGILYGFIFQGFYKFALKKYRLAELIYAYIFPMLLMQFMGEFLFTNFSTFLQMLVFFSIPYFFKIKV